MRERGIFQLIPVLIILAAIAFVLVLANSSIRNKLVSLLPSPTPVETPTLTPTPTSTATPRVATPKPTPIVTLTPKPTSTSAPISTSDKLPSSGYSVFNVATDLGTFKIAVGGADIATTKVVVDTASDSDCSDNCPAYPLSTYVQRRNAYAGINGTYFCPPGYTTCSGTNSFNFLVMNMNKYYFNSSQNVYSTNPGVIISGSYVRFVGQVTEWGRDTGPDMVLSNYPMLVQGGNIAYTGSSDSKITSKTTRSFIANKGNIVYIGDVFGASMEEVAHVLKTLGVDNALNLDDSGSAAFWWGGYKVGPGRNLPNAILFIQR
jgi:hypothetical protein